jgi:hypothetical protein
MLSAALDKGASAGQPESSSSTCVGRDAYTAVLPWLVLLGRFCNACALLVHDWQGSGKSSGTSSSYQQPQRTVQASAAIVDSLLLLQDSMAGVVQCMTAAVTVQQLSALGYHVQDMQQQLAEATEGLRARGWLISKLQLRLPHKAAPQHQHRQCARTFSSSCKQLAGC